MYLSFHQGRVVGLHADSLWGQAESRGVVSSQERASWDGFVPQRRRGTSELGLSGTIFSVTVKSGRVGRPPVALVFGSDIGGC
jgi:hypothetical protein